MSNHIGISKSDFSKCALTRTGLTKVHKELSLVEFKHIISDSDIKKHKLIEGNKVMLIVKFGAEWCRPCKQIKPMCDKMFTELPDNIICFDIDIDETMDLYVALKKYKMVSGVPCLLSYYLNQFRPDDEWYIPNDSVIGGNPSQVEAFFDRCKKYADK